MIMNVALIMAIYRFPGGNDRTEAVSAGLLSGQKGCLPDIRDIRIVVRFGPN